MEAVIWEGLTWQIGLGNPFHSVRSAPLLLILDQFWLPLLFVWISFFFF